MVGDGVRALAQDLRRRMVPTRLVAFRGLGLDSCKHRTRAIHGTGRAYGLGRNSLDLPTRIRRRLNACGRDPGQEATVRDPVLLRAVADGSTGRVCVPVELPLNQ